LSSEAKQEWIKVVGKITFDELKQAVAEGSIDTVLTVVVDMQGRLMGKRMQGDFFVDSAWEETHCCNYLLATDMEMETVGGFSSTSWEDGYGDYVMKPDLETLRRVPWLEGTALVMCDFLDHNTHADIPCAPRSILKKQVARLEAMGMKSFMASELEFFLFKESYEEARTKRPSDLTPISAYNEDYHIFQTTKEEGVMRAIRNGLNGADIPVENSKGEACSGQEEINVRYTDVLTMADRHAIIKNGCKEIAWAKGHALSFMAKWSYEAAGNSSHLHQSLRDLDGSPLFYDREGPHGMSKLMEHYLAGLLQHSSAMTYFLAPYINSYKRFMDGTFAPTKAIWSMDNRTAGYRICGAGTSSVRVECRIGGADLNPYLAMAAQLAAGIDGIENKLALEPAFVGNAYEGVGVREIPTTLREALVALDGSKMLRAAFGGDVVDHYLHAGQWEQHEQDRRVTDWEVLRGFERA
jgi:glutamine synthetase